MAGIPTTSFQQTCMRYLYKGHNGRNLTSTLGSKQASGRYHVAGSWAVLYLCTSLQVCLAEWLRRQAPQLPFSVVSLQSYLSLAADFVVGQVDVDAPSVWDLTDGTTLAALGTNSADLLHPTNYTIPQSIGHRAFQAGVDGLLAPSVTGVGENIVLFERRRSVNSVTAGSSITLQEAIQRYQP